MKKLSVLFVYDLPPENEVFWRDGLYEALKILEKHFEIIWWNLKTKRGTTWSSKFDFVLGHGGFNSSVDKYVQGITEYNIPKGLCVAGNALFPRSKDNYNVLFVETNWHKKKYIKEHSNCRVAFGVNTSIFYPAKSFKIWSWVTPGSFSVWKHMEKIVEKEGNKLAVGYIQRNNIEESMSIITYLISNGVMISDMVTPETLAKIYNATENVGIFSDIYGGGERSVWEARMCNTRVEVADDNEKLQELVQGPISTE